MKRAITSAPWRRLRERGVLGINERNLRLTQLENPRRLYPLVDDKLKTKALCEQAVISTAAVLSTARYHAEVREMIATLRGQGDFVLKPAAGAMGNGILVLRDPTEGGWLGSGNRFVSEVELAHHARSIVSGLYSLTGRPDVAFAEERLQLHPVLRGIAWDGVPDIRFVIFRGVPVMAMTRLPTSGSAGRANLHQGAVGAGIDLASGRTNHAVIRATPVEVHPDTGERVVDFPLPDFDEMLRTAVRACDETGLGYVGADVVLDATRGPVVLELNARPGLAIQLANRRGLRPRLDRVRRVGVDARRDVWDLEARLALGRELARSA